MYWRMKKGGYIPVDEMSTEHLKNTLKMLIRNSPGYNPETQRVEPIRVLKETSPRGDAAQMFNEQYNCDFDEWADEHDIL